MQQCSVYCCQGCCKCRIGRLHPWKLMEFCLLTCNVTIEMIRCFLALSRNTYGPVHCLVCCKPQKRIEDHLRSSCLPDASESQIQAEVFRTKKSQKKWAERGRTLHFSDVRRIVREDPSCDSLCQYFRKRGFLITEENDRCRGL